VTERAVGPTNADLTLEFVRANPPIRDVMLRVRLEF
jgi:hypothetical protein